MKHETEQSSENNSGRLTHASVDSIGNTRMRQAFLNAASTSQPSMDPGERRSGFSSGDRHRALRRLRRFTAVAAITASGLLALFGFVSAKTYSGGSGGNTAVVSAPVTTRTISRRTSVSPTGDGNDETGKAVTNGRAALGKVENAKPTRASIHRSLSHHRAHHKRHRHHHTTSVSTSGTSSTRTSTPSPTVTSPSTSSGTQATTGGSSVS